MTAPLICLLLGVLLDLLIGDPRSLPHPVRGIGWLIAHLEPPLRRLFPLTPAGERWAGRLLVLLVTALPTALTASALAVTFWACAPLSYALGVLLTSQCLSHTSLRQESMKVHAALTAGDLPAARTAVSMIVGRDTEHLDEEGVAKAAVETVAENFSDGIIAPLLFLALAGPAGGIFYKAVNTLDSMVGYQTPRYQHFGRCAALIDDLLNLLPARLSGLLLCLAAPLMRLSGKDACRIFRRDRKNHKSPNSAHTEAAAAGALGVQLAGPSYYFGQLLEKPTIGDPLRPIEPEDIRRVNGLVARGYALAVVLVVLLAGIVLLLS